MNKYVILIISLFLFLFLWQFWSTKERTTIPSNLNLSTPENTLYILVKGIVDEDLNIISKLINFRLLTSNGAHIMMLYNNLPEYQKNSLKEYFTTFLINSNFITNFRDNSPELFKVLKQIVKNKKEFFKIYDNPTLWILKNDKKAIIELGNNIYTLEKYKSKIWLLTGIISIVDIKDDIEKNILIKSTSLLKKEDKKVLIDYLAHIDISYISLRTLLWHLYNGRTQHIDKIKTLYIPAFSEIQNKFKIKTTIKDLKIANLAFMYFDQAITFMFKAKESKIPIQRYYNIAQARFSLNKAMMFLIAYFFKNTDKKSFLTQYSKYQSKTISKYKKSKTQDAINKLIKFIFRKL